MATPACAGWERPRPFDKLWFGKRALSLPKGSPTGTDGLCRPLAEPLTATACANGMNHYT
jgi:hypothetical protein